MLVLILFQPTKKKKRETKTKQKHTTETETQRLEGRCVLEGDCLSVVGRELPPPEGKPRTHQNGLQEELFASQRSVPRRLSHKKKKKKKKSQPQSSFFFPSPPPFPSSFPLFSPNRLALNFRSPLLALRPSSKKKKKKNDRLSLLFLSAFRPWPAACVMCPKSSRPRTWKRAQRTRFTWSSSSRAKA